MARSATKRGKRPQPNAPRKRAGGGGGGGRSPKTVEQTLFFTRLRRNAKWVFVLLALVFAGGFVFFGVGSGSSGIGDLLRGNFSFGGKKSAAPNVDKARKKIAENPKNADAYKELATALQADRQLEAAIQPLEQYIALRPKDADALALLASLYVNKAQRLQTDAQAAGASLQSVSGPSFGLNPSSKIGQALRSDPISDAVATSQSQQVNKVYTDLGNAYTQSEDAYRRLVKLQPDDASLQLQLAQSAENARDYTTAVGAYKRFLKLAPDDPSAPLLKQRITQLAPPPPKPAKPAAKPKTPKHKTG